METLNTLKLEASNQNQRQFDKDRYTSNRKLLAVTQDEKLNVEIRKRVMSDKKTIFAFPQVQRLEDSQIRNRTKRTTY